MKYLLNNELNGIEIYFDGKPEAKIIEKLKEYKFRWNHFKKCWYAKQKQENIQFAEKLINGNLEIKENKEIQNHYGVKIGDIFTYSWGWEQTNVDCFQVIGLKGKSTAILREIGKEICPNLSKGYSSMAGMFVAVKDSFISEKTIEKRIQVCKYSKNPYMSLNYDRAYKWDGKEFMGW
jgi:hypothetical protein